MEYTYIDNDAPHLARVKNARCEAVHFYLHPNEPADDLSQPVRILRYPPISVVVRSLDMPAYAATLPIFPMLPITRTFKVALPRHLHTNTATSIKVQRRALPLGDAYAITDFFAQGLSFKHNCWLAHLTPPPNGQLTRATLLVILTRFASWSMIRLLTKLWPDGDNKQRKKVINRYLTACQPDQQQAHDTQRLQQLATTTQATWRAQFSQQFPDLAL